MQCDGVQIDARRELPPTELSHTGLRQLRKILDDLNLRVGSVAFPTRRGYVCQEDLERRMEATRAAMQLASSLGARILICNLGKLPDQEAEQEIGPLVDAITTLAEQSHRLGVQLVAQAAGSPVEILVEFVRSLPEGTLWLDLHPAQLIAHDQSPREFISTAGSLIGHVHAVDSVYDLASGHAVEVELGRGTADFPELLGGLEEFGYQGWLTIERRDSRNAKQEMANAVQFLRAM